MKIVLFININIDRFDEFERCCCTFWNGYSFVWQIMMHQLKIMSIKKYLATEHGWWYRWFINELSNVFFVISLNFIWFIDQFECANEHCDTIETTAFITINCRKAFILLVQCNIIECAHISTNKMTNISGWFIFYPSIDWTNKPKKKREPAKTHLWITK